MLINARRRCAEIVPYASDYLHLVRDLQLYRARVQLLGPLQQAILAANHDFDGQPSANIVGIGDKPCRRAVFGEKCLVTIRFINEFAFSTCAIPFRRRTLVRNRPARIEIGQVFHRHQGIRKRRYGSTQRSNASSDEPPKAALSIDAPESVFRLRSALAVSGARWCGADTRGSSRTLSLTRHAAKENRLKPTAAAAKAIGRRRPDLAGSSQNTVGLH